jgi:hypothetical protein
VVGFRYTPRKASQFAHGIRSLCWSAGARSGGCRKGRLYFVEPGLCFLIPTASAAGTTSMQATPVPKKKSSVTELERGKCAERHSVTTFCT